MERWMHTASDVLSFLMIGELVIVLLLTDEQPGSSTILGGGVLFVLMAVLSIIAMRKQARERARRAEALRRKLRS